jgi:flagellar hook-associated protein 3 FlgL
MRITESMKYANVLENLSTTTTRLARANQVASSGVAVQDPSDDPTAWSLVQRLDARVSLGTSRSTTLRSAASDLDTAEGALASGTDLIVRAKEIAVAMSNGSVAPADRKSAAVEVDAIRNQLLALANTKGANGYLFGGNETTSPPFDTNANFVGDDGVRNLELSESKTARSNVSGARAFTVLGGRDLFADLAQLSQDLNANNVAGVTSALGTLDSDHQQIVAARIDAGTQSGVLSSAADMTDSLVVQLRASRSGAGDADVASAYSELTAAQQAYEAALAVTQRVLSVGSLASK